VIEFATITSAIAVLAASLSGLQARMLDRLTGSNAVAVRQAVVRATAEGVPRAGARAAFARAPYRRPALRYVYATAWAAGAKDVTACALAKLDVDATRDFAVKALRGDRGTLRGLGRLHLTVSQTATAFAQGFVSAC
jgi:hypothetical protein